MVRVGAFGPIVSIALAALVAGCGAGTPEVREGSASEPQAQNAEDFLIVDCLLPGQLRKLGGQMTYLTARRPIKTSAQDCELRGGEYVAYDRADYATALRVWLPTAEQGDAQAQTYVGEVYERGLGLAPDYEAARLWYRRAADQGSTRAMINLGNLYERGLGVPADPTEALNWYRRASGLDMVLTERGKVEGLERQVAERDAEIEKLRGALDRARSEASQGRRELEQRVRGARLVGDNLARAKDALTAAPAGEAESLRGEVERLQKMLAGERAEIERLRAQVFAAETRAERGAREIAALSTDGSAPAEPPSIQIIEPSMVMTRGFLTRGMTVARGVGAAPAPAPAGIVGHVSAPAGLKSLRVNGAEVQVDPRGIFRAPPTRAPQVQVVAVDRRGERAEVRFTVATGGAEIQPVAAPAAPAVDVDFGRYHALVIGNDAYRFLPRLESAVRDAEAVAAVLRDRYGFQVRVLKNVTRYETLSALNELRRKLTDQDNLLIYYAGHGELDRANVRGHWLPVDAEPENPTNWISNVAVTDLLNAMAARHVLIIADACYAGTLTLSATPEDTEVQGSAANLAWLRTVASKRARVALTSGGLKPVLDQGGGAHSIFAGALLEVLGENPDVLEGRRLFREVLARVLYASTGLGFDQTPEYSPIRYAGHEAGDFLLVPKQGS
ncbi:MAG: caspase family protein [Myxococcales bacterium]|nr:caspase family protein [Myxococcales bacterium]